MEIHEVERRNREMVHDYFNAIHGIKRDDRSKRILVELNIRIYELYSSKGILLQGLGDKRIGNCFSEVFR